MPPRRACGHFGFVQHAVTGMLAPPGHVSAYVTHPHRRSETPVIPSVLTWSPELALTSLVARTGVSPFGKLLLWHTLPRSRPLMFLPVSFFVEAAMTPPDYVIDLDTAPQPLDGDLKL